MWTAGNNHTVFHLLTSPQTARSREIESAREDCFVRVFAVRLRLSMLFSRFLIPELQVQSPSKDNYFQLATSCLSLIFHSPFILVLLLLPPWIFPTSVIGIFSCCLLSPGVYSTYRVIVHLPSLSCATSHLSPLSLVKMFHFMLCTSQRTKDLSQLHFEKIDFIQLFS